MQKQTKLYAQYDDHNFGHKGQGVEVIDLEQAVQLGLDVGSPRFKTFEISSVEIDGETLKTDPKNHSEFVYVGIDQIFTPADVIESRKAEIEISKTLKDEFSRTTGVKILHGLIAITKMADPATRYIREGGQRGDFIELKDGEMVFDRQGQQLWPKPETAALDHGLDPNLGSSMC